MNRLTPAARLKTNGDTFFLPVPNEGIYFRNNVGTFRMNGEMIERWIEKLIPMFNGEHTLEQLTSGLAEPHRERVYEIAEALLQNGFIRDVSQDRPHRLPDGIMRKYGSQIAFLDSFGDSGAYRFQCYRQAGVLAVGSGPFFVALVSALIESGLPKFHMAITDSTLTNRKRLVELEEHAKKTDAEVEIKEAVLLGRGTAAWRELVRPFQFVMYVSSDGNTEEMRMLQDACLEEGKMLFPAVLLYQSGVAGPLVYQESRACWDSALRRLHRSEVNKDPEQHSFSSMAGAMLANVIVFELFKTVTEAVDSELRGSLYLLDLETLEGSWHKFSPHPLAGGVGNAKLRWLDNVEARLEDSSRGSFSNELFAYFNRITSKQTGIFHIWEEGDLRQLPLSQCRVQAVDPQSEGPADLLAESVCNGFTHEEARREAGLTGLEAYVSRLAGIFVDSNTLVGSGVGETMTESVARGLQACLADNLMMRHSVGQPAVAPVQLSRVEDDRCRYYLQSLARMQGMPIIGIGEELFGLPVVWVGASDRWYGSAGLNMTLALRKALQAALLSVQNRLDCRSVQAMEASTVLLGKGSPLPIVVHSCEAIVQKDLLRNALHVLKRNGRDIFIADMAVEPVLKEMPGAVVGVALREGER